MKKGTRFRLLTVNLCHVGLKKGPRFRLLTLNLCHVSVKRGPRFRLLTLNLCHVIISTIPKDGTHVSLLISACLQRQETEKHSFTVFLFFCFFVCFSFVVLFWEARHFSVPLITLSFYSGGTDIVRFQWFHFHYIVREQTPFVSSDFSHGVSLPWRAGHCLLPLSSLWFSCGKQDIVTATDYTVMETRHCYCHWLHRDWNKTLILPLLLPLITPCGKQDIVAYRWFHCFFFFWKTGHCSLALMSKCLFNVRNRTVFIVVYCNCHFMMYIGWEMQQLSLLISPSPKLRGMENRLLLLLFISPCHFTLLFAI